MATARARSRTRHRIETLVIVLLGAGSTALLATTGSVVLTAGIAMISLAILAMSEHQHRRSSDRSQSAP